MTNLEDFMNKKDKVKEYNAKRQKIEGSFSCQHCNLFVNYAIMDESNSLEWECQDGHRSYGRI
jgi:hypothetical protein